VNPEDEIKTKLLDGTANENRIYLILLKNQNFWSWKILLENYKRINGFLAC